MTAKDEGEMSASGQVRVEGMGQLFTRIYAECSDEAEAQRILVSLETTLAAFGPLRFSQPGRYWKIQEYFGFEMDFGDRPEADYTALVSLSDDGWLHMGDPSDRSSVWNYSGRSCFLIPQARWAEVQFFVNSP